MHGRLENGLLRLVELIDGEQEPWWIIGSTAMVLSGIEGVLPDDIDVLADGDTLRRVLAKAGVSEVAPKPHYQFRSNPYSRIPVAGGVDIEVQGDLELFEHGVWTGLKFASRVPVVLGNATLYVPGLEEQFQTFLRFGRAKDLEKAALLKPLLG
jgi:hypothetical protein